MILIAYLAFAGAMIIRAIQVTVGHIAGRFGILFADVLEIYFICEVRSCLCFCVFVFTVFVVAWFAP